MSLRFRFPRRFAAALLLLLAGFAGGWVSATVFADSISITRLVPVIGPGLVANQETPPSLRQQFRVFWEVWNLVEAEFYQRDRINHTRMIRGAITGMLASLDDPYTVYQEPELASQTNEHMQGRMGGIGTYLRITDGRAFLYKPIKGAPADTAGLRQDDEIVAIDGEPVAPMIAGLDINEAAVKVAAKIRGQAGTQVRLTIRRQPGDQVFDITLTRADIVVPGVEAQLVDGGIAYIRIIEFKANTVPEFDQALRELLPQAPNGIVLDLRNNPGGFLDQARAVLGRFYNGVALYEQNSKGEITEIRTVGGDIRAFDVPVVVLVNGGSASASEIVAGALRDSRPNVTLIGEKTFGKGSVQNIYHLSDGSSARITFAHWLTPARTEIDKVGITPQYVIPYAEDPETQTLCVGDRQPPPGATTCADNQLFYAIRLLRTGEAPPSMPAAAR
ncbi:S41 family peptidase [uncultured Chloroflexus sp.]|uniref:S41 family peptidase n=1 Tax=uncultured Chloroflexus sp. TaxID=214040 RepID=UPI002618605D|nr:S41 family peptidase [uncultured Chloroflexus sp.]